MDQLFNEETGELLPADHRYDQEGLFGPVQDDSRWFGYEALAGLDGQAQSAWGRTGKDGGIYRAVGNTPNPHETIKQKMERVSNDLTEKSPTGAAVHRVGYGRRIIGKDYVEAEFNGDHGYPVGARHTFKDGSAIHVVDDRKVRVFID